MVGRLMVVGLGKQGAETLNLLARTPGIGKLYAADIDAPRCREKVRLITEGANYLGYYPDITPLTMDLYDVDATAETLRTVQPDVIASAASVFPGWKRALLLSPALVRRLSAAGKGAPFMASQALFTYLLMRAVRKAGTTPHVVNYPMPDYAGWWFGMQGLDPTVGCGNTDFQVHRIRAYVSERLKVPLRNVTVFLVGHSYHLDEHSWIKVLAEGRDVSEQFSREHLVNAHIVTASSGLAAGAQPEPALVPDSYSWSLSAGMSAARYMTALYFDTQELFGGAESPCQLPGAYPARIGAAGAEIVLPDDWTLQEAEAVNMAGVHADGVDAVRTDGTMVFTDRCVRVCRETLNYAFPKELRLEEIPTAADALYSALKRLGVFT